MKRAMLGVLGLVGLMGCNELKGTLTVSAPLNMINDSKKAVSVPVGNYESQVSYDTSKRKIQVKIAKVQGKDQKLVMQLPAGVEMPTSFGQIVLHADEINQSFDFMAELNTDIQTSGQTSSTETCSYTTTAWICRDVRDDASINDFDGRRGPGGGGGRGGDHDGRGGRGGDRGGDRGRVRRVCGNELVTRVGSQQVQYHYVSTTKSVRAMMVEPGTQNKIAELSNTHSDSDKIYDYQGPCN